MSIECLAQLYHQSSTPRRLRVQTLAVNAEEFHSSSVGFLLSACYTVGVSCVTEYRPWNRLLLGGQRK